MIMAYCTYFSVLYLANLLSGWRLGPFRFERRCDYIIPRWYQASSVIDGPNKRTSWQVDEAHRSLAAFGIQGDVIQIMVIRSFAVRYYAIVEELVDNTYLHRAVCLSHYNPSTSLYILDLSIGWKRSRLLFRSCVQLGHDALWLQKQVFPDHFNSMGTTTAMRVSVFNYPTSRTAKFRQRG